MAAHTFQAPFSCQKYRQFVVNISMNQFSAIPQKRDVERGRAAPSGIIPLRSGLPIITVSSLDTFMDCPLQFYLKLQYTGKHPQQRSDRRQERPARQSPVAPAPTTAPRFRSKDLFSDSLGIKGRCRILERSGQLIPVLMRNRRATTVAMSELVLLGAYSLLLSVSGERIARGILWCPGDDSQLEVSIDEGLLRRTMEVITEARKTAGASTKPAAQPGAWCSCCCYRTHCDTRTAAVSESVKLDDLVSGFIEAGLSDPPGDAAEIRLPEGLPMYVQDQGASVSLDGACLKIATGEGRQSTTRLADISEICLMGNVQITVQALRMALRRDIPVLFFSSRGRFEGIAQGFSGNNAAIRKAQFAAIEDPLLKNRFSCAIVNSKIRNSRTLMRRNLGDGSLEETRQLTHLAARATTAEGLDALRGIEGAAASIYFGRFGEMIGKQGSERGLSFETRNRRPPRDPVNAMLSFSYGLLVKDCVVALMGNGLDPMHGLYHTSRPRRPGLALDLMEPFRPMVCEGTVLSLVNRGELTSDDFENSEAAVMMAPEARRKLLHAYERRLGAKVTDPASGRETCLRTLLYRAASSVAAFLLRRTEVLDLPVWR